MKVGDKDLQTDEEEFPRSLRWRDIVVLCRSNSKASNLAARLQRCGIPAARWTEGLMSSPEAVLTLACLRWLSDDRDSLVVAEILTLEENRDVEDWLENRLTWVAEQSKGQRGLDGDLSSPVLGRISHLRAPVKMLTPSELLDPGSNSSERAVSYSRQLAEYREAMSGHGLTVSSSWIHFCTQGWLVEIR